MSKLITLLILVTHAAAQTPPRWWLRVADTDGSSVCISEDGKVVEPAGSLAAGAAVPSPDGQLWVRAGRGRTGPRTDLVLDGNNRKSLHLTDTPGDEAYPCWAPNGKAVVFCTRVGRLWQPMRVTVGSRRGEVRRLATYDGNVVSPTESSEGLIAWIERPVPKRFTKLPKGDLVLTTAGGKERVVLETAGAFLGCRFSPDGRWLVVARSGAIDLWDVPSQKKTRTWDLEKLGKKLHNAMWAHGAWAMSWRPDSQAFACRITFLGGREGNAKVFGDHEVFLFPVEGSPIAKTLDAKHGIRVLWWEPKQR